MTECKHVDVPGDCCYVRFAPNDPSVKRSTKDIGRTARGEWMIADLDAEGRIVGIELLFGPAKPCQESPTDDD